MDRTKGHFLQKLYAREIHGKFTKSCGDVHDKAIKLFTSVPDRLMFFLRDVFPHMGKHILVGITRCGQFLITYSYTTDVRLPGLILSPSQVVWYKYRLHWWAFRPGAPAYKVAEVQLFDNQDVTSALTVGIAQWSNVNDKLIVYGSYNDGDTQYEQEEGDESRKYYITVTTLPSLHDCKDCKAVAESFDEEDMAANWDSCIGLSCLKHGLTIHTTLDIAPPYPSFDILTNLKIDYKIIVNTGNFLHVLSFESDKEEVKPSHDDNIVPAEICHNIGEKLSLGVKDYICPWKKSTSLYRIEMRRSLLTPSVNKQWLNTIMDQADKVYTFEESEDRCEPRFKWFRKRKLADKMYEFCSDEEDMENVCPPAKRLRFFGQYTPKPSTRDKIHECPTLKVTNCLESNKSLDRENFIFFTSKKVVDTKMIRAKQKDAENRRRRENSEGRNIWTDSCDCGSNECDMIERLYDPRSPLNVECHKKTAVPQQTLVDSVSCRSDCDNVTNTPVSSTSKVDPLPPKSDFHKIPPLDVSIINPDLSALLAEWEADSVSSLSPKSDSFLYKKVETKNDVIQSFLELIPGMTLSPRSSSNGAMNSDYKAEAGESPHSTSRITSPNSPKYSPLLVVLRTRNCNQEKEHQKSKEPEDKCKGFSKEEVTARVSVKPGKDADLTMRQRMISGCSVRFDRIYIEVDEEIISTITDIEDDDQGTGFHCALPLSVHGSAYAQLQMVSSHKAEKMNIHCERVYQTSLDIEQFCFKAADIICKCEGFKFWSCDNYDVEIIDVCAFNGDILGVVCLRVNAEKQPPKSERHRLLNLRYCYEVNCVFVWNPGTDRCWLEAYSELGDVSRHVDPHWAPAKQEATKLRDVLKNCTLFSVRPNPPIRTFAHRMWNNHNVLEASMEEIRDHTNLIGFRLLRIPQGHRQYIEFL